MVARGPQASRFVWAEVVDVPLGGVGAAGWRVARPVIERVLDRGLDRMRQHVEEQAKTSTRTSEPS